MKGSIKTMPKASLVHKLFYITFAIWTLSSGAQTQLTNEEYKVINAIFDAKDTHANGKDAHIYEMTLFAKGWSHYFKDIEKIFKNVGAPTIISDNELKEKLTKKVLSKIHSEISQLKPYQLSSKKLNSIKLYDDFDSFKALKRGVFRISKPIIVNNEIAIVKKVSISESPIYILEKSKGEWRIIYTFYDWLILN